MQLASRVTNVVPNVPAEQRAIFAELVEQHRALVCGVAYSTIGNKAMSEEIAQEAFLTAWKKLPELTDPSRLPSWLCGIARHLALNARRKTAREVASEEVPNIASSAPTPFESLSSKESKQFVWQALEELPENDREALVLFYRADKSVKEVASALDVSESVARQRLSRGRKRLTTSVATLVEQTLTVSKPTAAFTACVMLAFDNANVAHAATSTAAVVQRVQNAADGANHTSTMFSSKTLPALLGITALIAVAGVAVVAGWGESRSESDHVATGVPPMVMSSSSPTDSVQQPSARSAAPPTVTYLVPGGSAVRGKSSDNPRGDSSSRSDETPRNTVSALDSRAGLQQKVDLDFAQADVHYLLRFVADIAEVDILTKGDISALVTIRLRRTPVIEVLDEILFQAGAKRTEIPVLRLVKGSVEGAHLVRGTSVTADFENASIREVMKIINEHTDIPIVVPKQLSDSPLTTLKFSREPFGLVFSRVLQQAGLGFETGFGFEVTPDVPPNHN
ncbi:MAG: sigma-70 family RNA polymerase sigma factor [Myxococcales bacterium]|nr:sigma-70 family RNA polymerase sigma factor [Myxococcales bacterium]